MSGVYIKGMQMPKGCKDCDLVLDLRASMLCPISGEFVDFEDTPETVDCPLIPVPDHGRLIDVDAFIKQQTEQICKNCDRRRGMKDGKLTKRFVYAIGDAPCRACGTGDMLDYVDDAPVIIPADKEADT